MKLSQPTFPDCFPDQLANACQPHQVSKVHFRALPQEQVAAMSEGGRPAAVMMDGVPFYLVARRSDEITTVIDVSDRVEANLRGIQCYTTQVGRQNRFVETPDEVMREPWFRRETFVLARSTVGWPERVETDLFAGLR